MKKPDEAMNRSVFGKGHRWLITIGIMAVILVAIGTIHVTQVRYVRHAASTIEVGHARDQVIKLLGNPRVTYSSGFPPEGGAATIYGSCYGGLLSSLQKLENWPVVIEFDKDGNVVKVKK